MSKPVKCNEENKQHVQLTEILNRISDGFVALDMNWCYTYMNKKAGEIVNRDPVKMIGTHIWTEFPEVVGQPFHQAYEKAMKEQQYVNLIEYYPLYDKWFENHIYPSPVGLTIYFKDITEKKKAEKVIAESEYRLRTILETEPECVKLLNQKGELIEMNPAGLTMIEADDLETVKGKSLFGIINEPFRDAFSNLIKKIFKGESGTLVFEITGLKGTSRCLETHAVPLKNLDGNIISLLGVTRDITERKKAEEQIKEKEEKYRTLAESSIDYIMRYDAEHRHTYMNKAALEISGYKESDIIGKTHLEAGFDPEQSAFFEEKIDYVFKTGEMIHEQFFWESVKGPVNLDWRLSPEMDQEGKVKSVLGVSRDITKLKKTEQQIIQLNQELEQRVKERTAELLEANTDLEEINDLFVGREYRIIEMKEELELLKIKVKEFEK